MELYKRLFLMVGMLVFLVGLVSASIEYTQTTDTICNNGICTKTLYSGVRNVYEDNTWKRVEDARSLMGKGFEIIYLENDKKYPIEVVDFNLTSIKVKLNPKGIKIFNEDIPVRVWKNNQTKQDDVCESAKTVYDFEVCNGEHYKEISDKLEEDFVSFNLLNQEEDKTYNFGLGHILEFGINSTTIILQDADSENLDDTSILEVNQGDDNFGADDGLWFGGYFNEVIMYDSILKFNIKEIPLTATIINATLDLRLLDNNVGAGKSFNLDAYHVYNFPYFNVSNEEWTEGTGDGGGATSTPPEISWGTLPNRTIQMNTTNESSLTFDSSSVQYAWFSWNITNMITKDILNAKENITILINTSSYTGTPDNTDTLEFGSKEEGGTNSDPKILITYILPLAINIIEPQNITYTTLPTTLDWTIGGALEETCWYSIDLGVTNTTVTCGDLSTAISWEQGNNQTFMWANDSDNNIVSSNVTFYVDSINPEMIITNPINNSNISSATFDLNYTFTETNGDKCWYSNNSGVTNSSYVSFGTNWTNMIGAEGDNDRTIYCNDTLNNLNSSIVYFTIDTIYPQINITYPIDDTNYTDNTLDIEYTFTEINPDTCWYSNDTMSANTTISCGTNITGITWIEGQHNVTVWINDTVNQINQSSITFYVDSISPVFTDWSASININNDVDLSYDINASDTNFDSFTINSTTLFDIDIDTGLLTNKSRLIGGTHKINITINDSSNNIHSDIFSVIVADVTPPIFIDWSSSIDIYAPDFLSYDVNATDETSFDSFSINWTSIFSINAGTGLLTNTSALPDESSKINITIKDSSNNIHSDIFTVNFYAGGTAPTWTDDSADVTLRGGGGGDYTISGNTINVTNEDYDKDRITTKYYYDNPQADISNITNFTSGGVSNLLVQVPTWFIIASVAIIILIISVSIMALKIKKREE